MSKTILHAHNYGHQNIGDDAMAENVFRKLNNIENAEVVTVSTYSPPYKHENDVLSLSGIVMNYKNPLVKIFLVAIHRLKLKPLHIAYSWLMCEWVFLLARIEKSTGVICVPFKNTRKLLKTMKVADVFVRSGSGSLNDIWFWSSMYPQYTEARICKLYGVDVYFTGQGIGPLASKYRKNVFSRFLRCCKLITFRDFSGSEDFARLVAPSLNNWKTVGDDAFDYPKENVSEDVESLFADDKKVLVCQFRPTNYESQLSEEYWRKVAATLEQFVDEDKKNAVLLVSFSNGSVKDLAVAEKIDSYANHKLVVLDKVLTPGQAKYILSRAYLAIGQSYHFGVFALAENVPFIGLYTNQYYKDKHKGLLGWYQLEEYAISENDMHRLSDSIRKISDQHCHVQNALLYKNTDIQANINQVFTLIGA